MPSSERIRGNDTCFIQKFEGLPGKSKEIKETKGVKTQSLDDSVKASFQTTIQIKEDN